MKTLAATLTAVVGMLIVSVAVITQAETDTRIVNVGCTEDLDQTVNQDAPDTATRFELGACAYPVSTTLQPESGDTIIGVEGQILQRPVRGTDPAGLSSAIEASGTGSLAVIMKPRGHFEMEWVDCSGAHFDGTSGSGVCIAGGNLADTSQFKNLYIHHNDGAGVTSARGVWTNVESAFNGGSGSLGFIAAGIKGRNFYEVSGGWFHGNTGNGLWCDSGCDPSSSGTHPNGFYVHNVDASDNDGAGVRYENSRTKALIEDSHIWGNSKVVNRAGISVRDAQNATIENNIFDGQGYAHNQAPDNIGIRADSGGRIPTKNILIRGNDLNGEQIKSCGGPVSCQSNQ